MIYTLRHCIKNGASLKCEKRFTCLSEFLVQCLLFNIFSILSYYIINSSVLKHFTVLGLYNIIFNFNHIINISVLKQMTTMILYILYICFYLAIFLSYRKQSLYCFVGVKLFYSRSIRRKLSYLTTFISFLANHLIKN